MNKRAQIVTDDIPKIECIRMEILGGKYTIEWEG